MKGNKSSLVYNRINLMDKRFSSNQFMLFGLKLMDALFTKEEYATNRVELIKNNSPLDKTFPNIIIKLI